MSDLGVGYLLSKDQQQVSEQPACLMEKGEV